MRATPPHAAAAPRTAVERLLVVANRRAAAVARRPTLLSDLGRAAGDLGEVVAPPTGTLIRVLGQARACGVDTVAICGGDGTHMQVASALRTAYRGASWPRLLLLSGGRTNTTAREFGSAGDPVEVLRQVLATPTPRVLSRPMIRVNEHVGFLFGTQMVARTMDAYDSGPSGLWGCGVLLARIVASVARRGRFARDLFASEEVALEIDGASLGRLPLRALIAGVVREVTPGLRVLYRAGEDASFHLVGTPHEPSRLLRYLPRFAAGLPVPQTGLDRLARRAVVRFEGDGRYTLDGDLFRAGRIELAATPPVTFLVPPPR
jgi:diacylglycerol kinase family enzyme